VPLTTDEILDRILVPRPNGSEALERVGAFLAEQLQAAGAEVSLHAFTATPHGFQLVWSAALLGMLLQALAVWRGRSGLALLLACAVPALLLAEFELLWSPVSGLWPAPEHNVVGVFPGAPGGPELVFTAHYDTATHFGDHFAWGPWGSLQGPATALAIALALAGLVARRRGSGLPRPARALAPLAIVPFAAMWWFHALGPLLQEPSPGAIDNGGSMTALLLLADELAERRRDSPATVRIVFLAAEEERALGSRAFARTLAEKPATVVVNLESVGASHQLALIREDGFALRRLRSPAWLVAWVRGAADLPEHELPFGVLTDGRSFLDAGIPTVTLRALVDGGFPRHLHSAADSRDRLSNDGIEAGARLLRELVRRADEDPSGLTSLPARR